MRGHEELRYTPVIILTAESDPSAKLKALELGATDLLTKPVDPSELRLRLRNALAFKAYQDRLVDSDPLTGLPNRKKFRVEVEAALARSAATGVAGLRPAAHRSGPLQAGERLARPSRRRPPAERSGQSLEAVFASFKADACDRPRARRWRSPASAATGSRRCFPICTT